MFFSRLLSRSSPAQRLFTSLQTIQDLRLKIDSLWSQKDLPSVESHLLSLMSTLPALSPKESQNLSTYLLTYGQSMASLNKLSLANELALKSESLIESLEDPLQVLTFTMYILRIYSLTESHSHAASLLERKKKLASGLETTKLKGDFYESLAMLKIQLSDLPAALSYMSEAFSVFSALDDKFSVFRCRVYLSVIHYNSNASEPARNEMRLSTDFLTQQNFRLTGEALKPISLWLVNLVTFAAEAPEQPKIIQSVLDAFQSHPLDAQFSVYEKFLEIIQRSDAKNLGVFISSAFLQFVQKNFQEKPGNIARVLYLSANEQAKVKNFALAVQQAEECLKIQEKAGHKYNIAVTLNLLTQICMLNQDQSKAFTHLERFGLLAKELGDKSFLKFYEDFKRSLKHFN